MNIAGLNALADTILAAQSRDRTPMGIAFSIASAGQHLTPELKAELERLRLLQNAQPAELSEAQVDALADAGNRALNDHYHDDLCHCSDWPESCASSGNYFAGSWDTAAFSIGMAAVIGLWESMRAPAEADELARLRALVAELEAAAYGDDEVRLLGPVEKVRHLRTALAAQLARANTLNWLSQENRARADAAEGRVAELEAERHATNEALSDAAEQLRRDRDRIAELEALTPASIQTCRKCGAGYDLGQPCSVCRFQAEMAAATAVRECGCPARFERHAWGCPTLPAADSHEGPEHHTYRLGRDLPEVPRG